tara:strand:+ start:333 stop:752 length:420 start_codon:yes stop_codon:yes gene_type:complete
MANGTIAFDTLQTSGQITGTAKSVDTDYVVNGSAKTHNRFNFDGNSITGSFNQSGVSDIGTGEYQATYTNNMSNANYTIMMSVGLDDGSENDYVYAVGTRRSVLPTSSTVNVQSSSSSGDGSAGADADLVMHSIFGDLA